MTEKILYLVQPAGFFESHRLHIALAAKKLGYEIHLVTNGDSGTLLRLANQGIYVHDLKIPRDNKGAWKEIISLWRIICLYRKIKPNICHHVTLRMIVFGMIASCFVRPRKIINAYSGLGFLFTRNDTHICLARLMLQGIMRLCRQPKRQFAIFQNEDDKKEVLSNNFEVPSNCVLIQGSGVDLDIFKYETEIDDEIVRIVYPARLLKDKGILEFLDAIKQVRKNHPNIYVQLAGSPDLGNPTSVTEEEILHWQSQGTINEYGFVADMAELYRKSHIICLPSYREGLPKSLLEAAASGRAIVTTDVVGCRELYDENLPAVLLVPLYDVQALADSIEKLVLDADLRNKLGANGQKLAELKYSDIKVREKTLSMYE